MITKKNILLIFLSAALVFLFVLYFNFAGNAGVYKEDERSADAIVVLAGGWGRIDKGIELFENGKANYLIIAGAGKDASLKAIFFKKSIRLDAKRILLEKKSTSTYENAVEIKKMSESLHIKSIILLTSYYHMKRASYIFSRIMPPHVDLHLYPVATPNFDETAWWRGNGSVLLAVEFFKFYWYRFWM